MMIKADSYQTSVEMKLAAGIKFSYSCSSANSWTHKTYPIFAKYLYISMCRLSFNISVEDYTNAVSLRPIIVSTSATNREYCIVKPKANTDTSKLNIFVSICLTLSDD